MAERRAKGQCFNCDELCSAGYRCKRLFCLLVDEQEEDDDEPSSLEPEISLHAIYWNKKLSNYANASTGSRETNTNPC